MPNDSRPKVRVAALCQSEQATAPNGPGRQVRMQRVAIVTLGCLWLLAFASGCSRNTKNCSAYDGVTFEQAAPVQN